VLFRGGDEKDARQHFINQGWLEAIIGLPAGLFYGTGIPACILVMNKKDASKRKHVVFINADREYREGKAQNFLRPEDISRIVHAYRTLSAGELEEIPAYARRVPVEEIEAEEFNCNIRRYVDNAPPPEPHDVRAHLKGGVPISEVDALEHFWENYPGLRVRMFKPRQGTKQYLDFTPAIKERRDIATTVNEDDSVVSSHKEFLKTLERWWKKSQPAIEDLAPRNGAKGNVYELRRHLQKSIEKAFSTNTLLTDHQIRGAFARYMADLKYDFKSIAASGWGPELIPDEDILRSQFPEVLEEMESNRIRIAELTALFSAADEEDYEDDDDTGILPGQQVRDLKTQLKELRGEAKLARRDPGMGDWKDLEKQAEVVEAKLTRHKHLEDEAKQLKADLRATQNKLSDLASAAREKIGRDEARVIIMKRSHGLLIQTYQDYLRADQRACIAALENLYAKYAVTAEQIGELRDEATKKLQQFLGELGYV